MAFPKNSDELSEILHVSKMLDCKMAILGAGTNILAPDEGIEGLVICLKDCMDGMERLDDHRIRVAAGVTMTRAAVFAANLGLSGLEFAHGIPGTVGGGVYMNAGAYGGEMGQVVSLVEGYDMTGGWHDAGDFGRYSTAAAVALGHILYAYELFPESFQDGLNIPESGNCMPDILNECTRMLGEQESRRKYLEDPFAFASIRDYTMQDPMKNINWKASAKTGDLMVNTFTSMKNEKIKKYTCFFLLIW